MNNTKKGVSLIVLVTIIIVMGIILGMIIINIKGTMYETEAREFANELKQLEYLVKQSKKLNDNKNLNFTAHTLSVDALTTDQKEQMSEEIETGVTSITLYEIDYDAIDAVATKYGKKSGGDVTDVYLISNTTGKVYYLKGFKWEDEIYYTLTDKLNELITI